MARLTDYLSSGMTAERSFSIEAKVMLWLNAGEGRVIASDDFYLAVEGRISVIGHERNFALQIALSDKDPAATVGPASIRFDDEIDGEAVYRIDGEKLVVLGQIKGDTVRIELSTSGPDKRHSLLDLSGARDMTLRLTPG